MALLLFIILMALAFVYLKNHNYKKKSYYKDTHKSFLTMEMDTGSKGEYLIYDYLSYIEREGGKFLFNCYLPKNNDETTELDVILICEEGIFVFESKNYSGWIFGNEKSQNWTQTLCEGRGHSRKEHFLNPIKQNNLHIKWLKKIAGNDIPIYSVIVFSERCTLKKIEVYSKDICVIKRNDIIKTVKEIRKQQIVKLSQQDIDSLYQKLYPFTQVKASVKAKHVANIQQKIKGH